MKLLATIIHRTRYLGRCFNESPRPSRHPTGRRIGVRWNASVANNVKDTPGHTSEPTSLGYSNQVYHTRLISTLDHTRITRNDYVNISNQETVCFRWIGQSHRKPFKLAFFRNFKQGVPFPPGTHGFLYYHAASGHVRLRVTPDSHPTSFPAGVDLLAANEKRPWHLNLKRIETSPNLALVRELLIYDNIYKPEPKPGCVAMVPSPPSVHSAHKYFTISTLHPERLQAHDFVDVSGRTKVSLKFQLYDKLSTFSYSKGKKLPPGTRGFFYYHTPTHPIPPIGGEVRFRITQNSDPASFAAGLDAKDARSYSPWSIALWAIARDLYFSQIRNQLLHEGLVTHDTLEKASKASNGISSRRSYNLLHHLDQDLQFNLEQRGKVVWTISAENNGRLEIPMAWFNNFRIGKRTYYTFPYRGIVRVRFERSPFPEHAGKRILLLRVVKIVEPVRHITPNDNPGDALLPAVGDFVWRRYKHSDAVFPLAFDIDKSKYSALQLLWEH